MHVDLDSDLVLDRDLKGWMGSVSDLCETKLDRNIIRNYACCFKLQLFDVQKRCVHDRDEYQSHSSTLSGQVFSLHRDSQVFCTCDSMCIHDSMTEGSSFKDLLLEWLHFMVMYKPQSYIFPEGSRLLSLFKFPNPILQQTPSAACVEP